jgi:DNA-binding NarL/FixJ family response regulator
MKAPDDIRIAIVEDDAETRVYLQTLIQGSPGFCITGSYPDGESLIRNFASEPADVVLVDIRLPGLSGIECISEMAPRFPQSNFIICTSFEDSSLIFEALQAGAKGYLLKSIKPARLLESLEDVFHGGSPMSSQIARIVVTHFTKTEAKKSTLSPREKELLNLLTDGLKYREIAERLFISEETVRTHARNIYVKLEVNSRFEALKKLKNG